ncbi:MULTISPECIES: VOC family protein [Rhodococcus]|jgi:catechol 2,3-dioxygenase-like lactoylglutathione lyase family enzyme|uniref:VOC family protein n=1 Tax=Rhodococcus jostii TaxID=132919 RepID=A0ABU4CLQ3_RHOJO|nr:MULTISPECIES: VOC family protein [Rhodococcus]EJI98079.1 glyoxalase/Bleomycin resistance protein/Dioxygenase superfamily protein [Rhodococcus sp. JVH1]MDV6284496.1 VOC family protein [Rhodococcus jostii]UZG55448.1 VOC family protein [Rhodococcus opacus]
MYLRLHHVNVTSDDMGELGKFYSDALGLGEIASPPMIATSRSADSGDSGDEEWATRARFYDAGDKDELQLHATRRQPYLALTEGHTVNPLIGGHVAFRTDDIQAVMERLRNNNIPFDDWGIWSVEGWYQIFLTDPAGNMIEIHQVMEPDDES